MEKAVCLDAIAGYDDMDDRSLGTGQHASFGFSESPQQVGPRLDRVKVVLLTEGFYNEVMDPRVRDHALAAAGKLARLGAVLELTFLLRFICKDQLCGRFSSIFPVPRAGDGTAALEQLKLPEALPVNEEYPDQRTICCWAISVEHTR
ncbi:amidase, partial [Metarhizium majus ARSEF 297]